MHFKIPSKNIFYQNKNVPDLATVTIATINKTHNDILGEAIVSGDSTKGLLIPVSSTFIYTIVLPCHFLVLKQMFPIRRFSLNKRKLL